VAARGAGSKFRTMFVAGFVDRGGGYLLSL
jgi:hypothetical protein